MNNGLTMNYLRTFIGFMLIALIQQGSASSAFISLDATSVLANPVKTQDIALVGPLGNTYEAKSDWQNNNTMMLGIGVRTYQRQPFEINSSIRFLPMTGIPLHGDVLQLYSPQFRNLAYTYNIHSNIVLFDNIMTWTAHPLQPGIILGIGGASNTASDYRELPLTAHASPGLDQFSSHTQAQLAYELGAVLEYPFQVGTIEFAYRYLDAGQGKLGLSASQTSTDHLSTGPLHYHILSLGVRLYHDV